MNSSGKKVVLFMLDRVHTIKNGNLLQDYRFIFIGYYYYSAPLQAMRYLRRIPCGLTACLF